jgi:hypothetical protein
MAQFQFIKAATDELLGSLLHDIAATGATIHSVIWRPAKNTAPGREPDPSDDGEGYRIIFYTND